MTPILVGFISLLTDASNPSPTWQAREDSSFHPLLRFSQRKILSIHPNGFVHRSLDTCPPGFTKILSREFSQSLRDLRTDSICIRLAGPADTADTRDRSFDCKKANKECLHPIWLETAGGWSSLKSYRGCRSTSAEYTGSASFALNLNDSLALAVTVTAIAGGKHLDTDFMDSIPEDQNPIYTAEISTSRMLCAPGKTQPYNNSERQQFHFGTYPQFRLFRMGGRGILVMRGRYRQDPSQIRVIETDIDIHGLLQSHEYFDKTLPDGKRIPYADYEVKEGILYRKVLDPQRAKVMDQGWAGLWVDRLVVTDYLRADSVARAKEDSLERATKPLKARP